MSHFWPRGRDMADFVVFWFIMVMFGVITALIGMGLWKLWELV